MSLRLIFSWFRKRDRIQILVIATLMKTGTNSGWVHCRKKQQH